ncbi:hypothetical protein QTP86_031914 [Hemibagrus guttatus]|nr:hypothetical protein QTP86_031914 [Hemibagrus guttatus]
MMQIISKFCDEINSDGKMIYTSGHPNSPECEPTWYAQYEYIFQVTNRTTLNGETKPTKTDGSELSYLWLLLILVLLVLLVLYFVCKKRDCSPKCDDGNADHLNSDAVMNPVNFSTPQNEVGAEADHLNGAAMMNNTPKKDEAQALNGHTYGIPKCDDGNVDHLNGDAVMIPLNSSTPQNEEEAEALNGCVLINEPKLTDDGIDMGCMGR